MDKSAKPKLKKVASPKIERSTVIVNTRPKVLLASPQFASKLEITYSNNENGFYYKNDNGILKRVLNVKLDSDYNIDPDYKAPQQWLLNNRQGDDQNRLPEYILDQEAARKEQYGMVGESTLNRGIVWAPIPYNYVRDPVEESYLKIINYRKDFEGDLGNKE